MAAVAVKPKFSSDEDDRPQAKPSRPQTTEDDRDIKKKLKKIKKEKKEKRSDSERRHKKKKKKSRSSRTPSRECVQEPGASVKRELERERTPTPSIESVHKVSPSCGRMQKRSRSSERARKQTHSRERIHTPSRTHTPSRKRTPSRNRSRIRTPSCSPSTTSRSRSSTRRHYRRSRSYDSRHSCKTSQSIESRYRKRSRSRISPSFSRSRRSPSYSSYDEPYECEPYEYAVPPIYTRAWPVTPLPQSEYTDRKIAKTPKFVITIRHILKTMKKSIKTAVEEMYQHLLRHLMILRIQKRMRELLKGTAFYVRSRYQIVIYFTYFPQETNVELVQEMVAVLKDQLARGIVKVEDTDEPRDQALHDEMTLQYITQRVAEECSSLNVDIKPFSEEIFTVQVPIKQEENVKQEVFSPDNRSATPRPAVKQEVPSPRNRSTTPRPSVKEEVPSPTNGVPLRELVKREIASPSVGTLNGVTTQTLPLKREKTPNLDVLETPILPLKQEQTPNLNGLLTPILPGKTETMSPAVAGPGVGLRRMSVKTEAGYPEIKPISENTELRRMSLKTEVGFPEIRPVSGNIGIRSRRKARMPVKEETTLPPPPHGDESPRIASPINSVLKLEPKLEPETLDVISNYVSMVTNIIEIVSDSD